MKYLKLFESEENMVDNIREVFQDMEDFELTLECDKMWEGVVQLDQPYNLQGYTIRKTTDTFYGYFRDGQEISMEWLDGNGYSIFDYYDNPSNHTKRIRLSHLKNKEFFYGINLSGNQKHIKDNWISIFKEIKNNVLRLQNMYDLKLHTNKDHCYKNGIIYDIHGSHVTNNINWISNTLPEIPNIDGKSHLGIYLK